MNQEPHKNVPKVSDHDATGLPIPEKDAAPPPRRSSRLRRWSVAELVARAVARPPAGGVAH